MNFRRETNRAEHKRGFTVIEAFVGIAVLLIGVVGPMVLVNKNFQSARFSRDQITAYYLAQEAIEVVRQIRDDNLLNSRPWDENLNACRTDQGGCLINGEVSDASGAVPWSKVWGCNPFCEDGDKVLFVDAAGRFSHRTNLAEPTNFRRHVTMNGERVSVKVDFFTGKYWQSYETVSIITDWTPTP